MNQKLFSVLRDKKGGLGLVLQVVCLTLGVYVSFPTRGLLATFPLGILFFLPGVFFGKKIFVSLAVSGLTALFYGLTTELAQPLLFAFYMVAQTLLSFLILLGLKKIYAKEKLLGSVLFFLSLILALCLPMLCCSAPSSYLSARALAREYLSDTYPEQRFSSMEFYYDAKERGYRANVSYEYEGNLLSSALFFGEEIEDGFAEDLSLWMQEKRKSLMIELLNGKDLNLMIETDGFEEGGVWYGCYGKAESQSDSRFRFSATFREEKPERREFAASVSQALSILQQEGFDFDTITFFALDAGYVVYRCSVTPETVADPDRILTLVTQA